MWKISFNFIEKSLFKKNYINKTVLGTVRPRYPRNHWSFKVTLETMFIKKTFCILTLRFWILKLYSLSCWFWDDNVWLHGFFLAIFSVLFLTWYITLMIYQICALTSLCNVSGGRVPRPVTNLSFRHNRKASYLRSQSVEERNETLNLEESSAGRCTTGNNF